MPDRPHSGGLLPSRVAFPEPCEIFLEFRKPPNFNRYVVQTRSLAKLHLFNGYVDLGLGEFANWDVRVWIKDGINGDWNIGGIIRVEKLLKMGFPRGKSIITLNENGVWTLTRELFDKFPGILDGVG